MFYKISLPSHASAAIRRTQPVSVWNGAGNQPLGPSQDRVHLKVKAASGDDSVMIKSCTLHDLWLHGFIFAISCRSVISVVNLKGRRKSGDSRTAPRSLTSKGLTRSNEGDQAVLNVESSPTSFSHRLKRCTSAQEGQTLSNLNRAGYVCRRIHVSIRSSDGSSSSQ